MSTRSQIAGYLRVAAYTIAAFDVACILFILVQYLGITAMLIGSIGFFYHGFSKEACAKFYWMAPVFKVFLYFASQAILALRTYAVSRSPPIVLRILIVLFIMCALGEFISTFWKRIPFQNNFKYFIALSLRESDLEPAAPGGISQVSKRPPYITVLVVVSMGIIVTLSRLARMMLEDGIMDFVALTAMNIVNLIFFKSRDTTLQSSASSLGFAVTMIFSSRFILNLSERAMDGVCARNLVGGHR
ncbi:hypothetical protein B0H13DRAFT_2353808 [Mycena leptocephala]|nr:hypothetical protein B0H13DRAFT_2353808 [Mycena leptocephala]